MPSAVVMSTRHRAEKARNPHQHRFPKRLRLGCRIHSGVCVYITVSVSLCLSLCVCVSLSLCFCVCVCSFM